MAITLAELNVIIGADDSGLRRQMTALQRSVSDLGQHMERVGKTLTVGLTAPLAALGTISVSAAAQLDSLTRGLTSVAGTSEEAERQLSRLQKVAKLPGLRFREAIQGSTRLQAAGFSATLAEEALRGFGNALATVGAGKAELDQVTRALTQIAAKGKISAEEINQLAEVVPQIRKVMQESFGTSNTELLQEAGISAEEFVTKVTEALNRLPTVTGWVQNAFENLSDSLFRARARIGQELLPVIIPLVDALTAMLTDIRALNPETVRWGIAFAAVAAAAGPLLIVVGSLTTAAAALAATLGATLGTVVAVGGPLVIALTALSALFLKNRLDALAAKGAVDAYTASLGGLNRESAEMEKRDLQRARAALETELATKEASLPGLADDPVRLVQATTRIKEIEESLAGLGDQYRIVSQRADELRVAAEDGPNPAPVNLASEAIKKLGEEVSVATGLFETLEAAGADTTSLISTIETLHGRVLDVLRDQGGALTENRLELERMLEALRNVGDIPGVTPSLGEERSFLQRRRDLERTVNVGQVDTARNLPGPTFGQRARVAFDSVAGAARGAGAGALDALGSSAMKLVSAFNPLGILATVFSSALESLAPSLEPLINIIGRVGGILAKALLPILEALWPVFKLTVIAATYLGQILFNVAGGIALAVGNVIKAIGWLVDKINIFGGDGGIGKAGQGLINMGKGFIDGASELGKARDEIKKLDWESATAPLNEAAKETARELQNVPAGFKVALARFNATVASSTAFRSVEATGGTVEINVPVTISGADKTAYETARETTRMVVSTLKSALQGRGDNFSVNLRYALPEVV